ncbi:ABC transporter ATP-binding protein [Metabacillus bambusae]|uniref:ABC transporter ATP-binding protein n=1 Tax=Metabacillus bambusae TaxID=2795218 RepID=A0ABS3NBU8_9BACI|nr:ABC transporter ATP-binding protein [Metabacillus bambusae]MBO1515530.1 ABC transporter ATP-binding protein [Metabacillus bambusae]
MADIKVENITKTFKKDVALKDVSFEVKDKEFFILFGPAGAGKTTLLNIIAGIYLPDYGHVYLNKKCIDHVEPEDRNVAMVFEDYALYPHLTVYDNMASPLRSPRYKQPKEVIDREVKRIAKILRIDWLLERNPSELSNGQRQRVGLGRALVRTPEVFLMDEPITHLDAKLRHQMRAELKDMQQNLDTTTIYVTHDYLEALSLGDRIAVINKGQIEQIGTPKEIYYTPANEFVASAFGEPEINIFDSKIIKENGVSKITIFDHDLSISKKTKQLIDQYKLTDIRIGIRPKNVKYSFVKKDENCILGVVYSFEPLGAKAILTMKIGNEFIRLLVSSDIGIELNQEVFIQLDIENGIFFDRNGENIIVKQRDHAGRELVWEN